MSTKKKYEKITVESLGGTISELETLYKDVYNKKILTEQIHGRWEERVNRSNSIVQQNWVGRVNNREITVPEKRQGYFNELLRIAVQHRDGTAEQINLLKHAENTILNRIEELKSVTKDLSLNESMAKNLQALDGGTVDALFTQNIVELLASTRSIKYQAEALIELRMDPTSNHKVKGEISGK